MLASLLGCNVIMHGLMNHITEANITRPELECGLSVKRARFTSSGGASPGGASAGGGGKRRKRRRRRRSSSSSGDGSSSGGSSGGGSGAGVGGGGPSGGVRRRALLGAPPYELADVDGREALGPVGGRAGAGASVPLISIGSGSGGSDGALGRRRLRQLGAGGSSSTEHDVIMPFDLIFNR